MLNDGEMRSIYIVHVFLISVRHFR